MSLKDWIKKIETTQLNEFASTNSQIQIKPASQMPKQPGQPQMNTAKPGQPQQPAQMNKNTQVISQGDTVLGTVDNPQLAQQIKQSIGKGEMSLAPDQLAEDDMVEGMGRYEDKMKYVIDSETGEVVDGPFENTSEIPSRLMGFDGAHQVVTGADLNHTDVNESTGVAEGLKESQMKTKKINEGAFNEIVASHPHEHKMCQEGWGMHESLYEALRDHYYRSGDIPRDVFHGDQGKLRAHVENCYAKDSGMVLGEEKIDEVLPALAGGLIGSAGAAAAGLGTVGRVASGIAGQAFGNTAQNMMSDEIDEGSKEDFTMSARQADPRIDRYADDRTGKPSFLDKAGSAVGGALKKAGSAVMNKLHPSDAELRGDSPEKTSKLEQMLRQSTKESSMYESKKTVVEATKKTKTGIEHTADAGGYGRKHEDDEKVKPKAKSDEPKRGRGRPKNTDNTSGEDKKFDTSELNNMFGGKKPKKEVGKLTKKNRIATKADREEVDETLKGGQKKLDINKNGKLDGADFAMLRNKKTKTKTKDAQMESWSNQLTSLLNEGKQLNEGLTVSTSVGNEGGNDTVSITASDADAHQLLQMLQNAGMGSGVPHHAISSPTMPAQVMPQDGQPTTGSIATTDGSPNPAAQSDIYGGSDSVPIMAMPRGMLLSVNDETEMPTEPGEFGTLDQEEVVSALGSEHGSNDDGGDGALAAIKKLMGQHGSSEVPAPKPTESKQTVDEESTDTKDDNAEEAGKKVSKDIEYDEGDDEEEDEGAEEAGEKVTKDIESDEEDEEDEEKKVDEGREQTCESCGGLMEDDHACDQLNEWANSPEGQSEDEQFKADMAFMMNTITAGLNGRKSTGQTTVPVLASQTNRQMSEGYNIDVAAEMRKLAGIR